MLPEPHDEDDRHRGWVGGSVGEGEGVTAVGADPGSAVGGAGVDALVAEAGALQVLAVVEGEVGDAVGGAWDVGSGEGVDAGLVDSGLLVGVVDVSVWSSLHLGASEASVDGGDGCREGGESEEHDVFN